MASPAEGVNPLRPYYIPPSISDTPASSSTYNANPFSQDARGGASGSGGYASKARDIFSDIDYNVSLGEASPSLVQNIKELMDELLWKYASILMAQPFEVAKTILQVHSQDPDGALSLPSSKDGLQKRPSGYGSSIHDHDESDSDGDEPAYFTSNISNTPIPAHSRGHSSRATTPSVSGVPRTSSSTEPYLAIRRPDSILDVIGQLWGKEAAWGVWKGANATFLYTVLQSLLENWSRSFLSAVFNVPDIGVKDDIDRLIEIASPYPWTSMFVAGAAAVATGVILAPLDLVRTWLILTPTTKGHRRTLRTLRTLPSYFCSSLLFLPTVLHSLVHPLLTLSTPLVLRTRFMVDSRISPTTFSFAKFAASSTAVLLKLPLETVLRRGQASLLTEQDYTRALGVRDSKVETIVPLGPYKGLLGTMRHITREEGTRDAAHESAVARKGKARGKIPPGTIQQGQGLAGLWRGWKVNWWGLVGLWAAGIVGNGGEGEF